MSLLRIRHYPDPVLKQKAERITAFDGELRRLADDMLETMYAAPGVGLAAPQVGVSRRLIVLDCSPKDGEKQPLIAVNPEILTREGECCEEEGCLSVPEYYAKVVRSEKVTVRFQDLDGVTRQLEAGGLWAVCFQHEIDHLDGVLFVDRLSPLKRSLFRKKYQKILEQRQEQL
ncbi:MAG: peptide deformylase [Deltaproteobacteria bacterium]|nr:MAG: peptide deformylase [Deltaproteobacteria bacterium]